MYLYACTCTFTCTCIYNVYMYVYLALLKMTSDLNDIIPLVNEFRGSSEGVVESLQVTMEFVGQRLVFT